jgi:hypothetical protein
MPFADLPTFYIYSPVHSVSPWPYKLSTTFQLEVYHISYIFNVFITCFVAPFSKLIRNLEVKTRGFQSEGERFTIATRPHGNQLKSAYFIHVTRNAFDIE